MQCLKNGVDRVEFIDELAKRIKLVGENNWTQAMEMGTPHVGMLLTTSSLYRGHNPNNGHCICMHAV